ncbi:MAG: aspartate/tyrosine/aromatic aminotransferase [Pirellulaceae bacterium]|nr:aspartate/tyrosine/aromatic aminotransferase [Pirellulaceae bacterium]
MLDQLELAPPDAILGLTEAFNHDSNSNKINLSVGVYKNEQGVTPILPSVKEAERRILSEESTKSYLPISGLATYSQRVMELLFGADHGLLKAGRAVSVQTPGGTGALRVAADFIKTRLPTNKIWTSAPTWANHPNIFAAAGLEQDSYPYLDPATNGLNLEGMLACIDQMSAGDVILLHGCCHNPSGIDPTADQWKEIASRVQSRGLLPLVDFAYQGFSEGIEQDARGLHAICEQVAEVLIASSYSKNFGLYRERIGALTAVGGDSAAAAAALSHLKACIRCNYSNPPAHGAEIVQTILGDASLRQQWEAELTEMRDRINGMRDLFVKTMKEQAPDRNFEFIRTQRGMFSFSGLTKEQVTQLRDEDSIYIVGSGRINVAGITPANIDQLCSAISKVIS